MAIGVTLQNEWVMVVESPCVVATVSGWMVTVGAVIKETLF